MDVSAFIRTVSNQTDAALEQELLTLNAHMSAATFRFLVLVRTFDERLAWGDWGMRSMAHWLNWRCGIQLGAAREQVRVAHALARLPQTAEALAQGRISYSTVRAFSRVATVENEDFFLEIAVHGTGSHMETLVHEGGFTITGGAGGALVFHTPRGKPVGNAPQLQEGSTDALVLANNAHSVHVSAETCDSRWDGLRADYDLVLTAFYSRPDVRRMQATIPY